MVQPLDRKDLEKHLAGLAGWSVDDDKLKKNFTFNNFRDAAAFIVRIAFEAESMQHHPELFNVYNKVNIALCTHEAGDKITEKDIALAKAIDNVYKH